MNTTSNIYFFDSASALYAAQQSSDKKQIFFYNAIEANTKHDNCIHVPVDNFVEYFMNSSHSYPEEINFDTMKFSDEIQKQIIQNLTNALDTVKNEKTKQLNKFLEATLSLTNVQEIIYTILAYIKVNSFLSSELPFTIIHKLLECSSFIQKNKIEVEVKAIFIIKELENSLALLKSSFIQADFYLFHFEYALSLLIKKDTLLNQRKYFNALALFSNLSQLSNDFALVKALFVEEDLKEYISNFSASLFKDDFLTKSIDKQKHFIYKMYYLTGMHYGRGEAYKEMFYVFKPIFLKAIEKELDELVFYLYTPLVMSWNGTSQTQEELKYFNDVIENPLESFIANILVKKYNLKENKRTINKNKKIKVAFLQERIINYSIHNVFYALIKLLSKNLSSQYEFIVYNLNFQEFGGSNLSTVENLKALGIKYVDLHQECVGNNDEFYSIIQKSLKVRRKLIKDKIDILIGMHSRPEYNFLFTTRTAPKQIYWSHGNDEYNLNAIDAKISMFNSTDKRFHFFEIQRDMKKYNPKVDIEEVNNIRNTYPKNSFILGAIGRLIKVDSDEYLQTVAKIMKENPNTIYLACGSGDNSSIKNKIKDLGIEDRFYFTGHVDAHIYGHVIDLWLSPFPFGGGEALEEYRYKGKPYVILYNNSHGIKKGKELQQIINDIQNSQSAYFDDSLYLPEDLSNLNKHGYINDINKQSQSYITLSFAIDIDAYLCISNEFIKNKILREKVTSEYLYYMRMRYKLDIDNNTLYNILKEVM